MRYDAKDCLKHWDDESLKLIKAWQSQGLLLALCPEVSGGLSVPRPAAEIQGKHVRTLAGEDVTSAFAFGAQCALNLCKQNDIQYAILKQGSPSCGNSRINDGSFAQTKVMGEGVTAKLLRANGIQVFNETELFGLAQKLMGK